MDDPEVARIVEELTALRRGGPVNAVDLMAVRLPTLSALLRLDPDNPGAARPRLIEALTRAADTLPDDLGTVFLIVYGIVDAPALVRDRLVRAGKVIHRDPRTVRRRLGRAERLIAEALSNQDIARSLQSDWYYLRYSTSLNLRATPTLTISGRLRVVGPPMNSITESLPLRGLGYAAPTLRRATGIASASLQRVTPNLWTATLRLDKAVPAGASFGFEVTLDIPDRRHHDPRSVMIPTRACRRYTCEVTFGDPPGAVRHWTIAGLPPWGLGDVPDTGVCEGIPAAPLRREFHDPLPGLAYGIGCEWGQPASPECQPAARMDQERPRRRARAAQQFQS